MGNSAGRLVSGAPLAIEREGGIERDEGVIRNKLVIHTLYKSIHSELDIFFMVHHLQQNCPQLFL